MSSPRALRGWWESLKALFNKLFERKGEHKSQVRAVLKRGGGSGKADRDQAER